MLVSGIQQSDSVIYILFHSLLNYDLLQDIEFPVLYSRILLFIHPTYTSLCLLTQTKLLIQPFLAPPIPLVNHKPVLLYL